MNKLELFTLIQAIGSILTVLVGIIGFWFLHRQLLQVKSAMSRDVIESLYARNHDIHRIIIENPHLRPYFYERKEIASSDPNYGIIMTTSEMVVDFYEGVSLQREFMSDDLFSSWQRYWQDLFARSPALREYLRENKNWYSEELFRDLLSTTILSTDPKTVEQSK